MLKRYLLITSSIAALSMSTSNLVAQTDSSKTTATASPLTLVLRVRKDDETPIADAELSVKSDKMERVVRTDANGNARFEGFPPGSIEIRVRRVGFKQAQVLARIAAGENDFIIHVDGSTVVLDEMRIIGNRRVVGRLDDFEMRTKRHEASAVVTMEQIERRNPVALSVMLRGMSGLRLADSSGSMVAISTRGMKLEKGKPVYCVMRVMIDGIVMSPSISIDDVTPKEAYGIEVFYGAASIPLKLQGGRTDQWCGLIAIWTRSG